MTTDPKPRLFDYDREPLGLLPESLKTTVELNDQRAIATLHSPRRRSGAAQPPQKTGLGLLARLVGAFSRLLR